MICTNPQLFIVIDPIWTGIGWEYDLEQSITEYLTTRTNFKQTVRTVVGQFAVKELFASKQVKNNAAFLFTEASSDLVILVSKYAKLNAIQIYTLGFWRRTHFTEFRYDKLYEQTWWVDFDRTCFKAIEKNMLTDEHFKHEFSKRIARKKYPFSIMKFPIPAAAIKDHLRSIQPVEFKTDMILIDSANYNSEHKRMISLLLSELKFPNPVSFVFAYENGTPTRDQYVRWLMNAKVVINFDVQGKIGDDVYEYYAARCIPLCNAPKFYTNIVPEEWRIETKWFENIGTFIDALPIIKHKVYNSLVNYDSIRPKLDFEEKRLETCYFSKDKFYSKLY